MYNTLRIATFNIHKGHTHFNARFSLHQQREKLRQIQADIVFLQEVQHTHPKPSKLFNNTSQAEFLADAVWPNYAYGKNSVYPVGHHGNAMLSKFPISSSANINISAHASEKRGFLHCIVDIPGWDMPLHNICVHLGLFAHWRRAQLDAMANFIDTHVPPLAPLIIAGDFNDWSTYSGRAFAARMHLHEVFDHHTGQSARSFPSWLPVLRLDRIYVRGFQIRQVHVHSGAQFIKLSDHALLSATLTKL